jgi:hypothetical protein
MLFVTSDPVTVGTQKCNQKDDWMLTGDIEVRISNASFTKTVYERQREPVRCKDRSIASYRFLTHDGYIIPVMIPSGLEGKNQKTLCYTSFLSRATRLKAGIISHYIHTLKQS